MSLLFIVGVGNDSNNQTENGLSIFVTSTTKHNEDESTFDSSYLLHGLNGVLCLFLFAFIFHLCKKSHLSKRTNGNCMTHGENNVQDESHQQDQQGRRQSYDTIPDSAITVQDYRSLESEYDEIDVKLQINNLQLSQTLVDDYERPNVSPKHSLRTYDITASDFPMNDLQVEINLESSLISVNIINPSDNKDKNTYLDIIP